MAREARVCRAQRPASRGRVRGGAVSGEAGPGAEREPEWVNERSQIVSERSLSVCSYSLVFVLFVLFTM